MQKSTKTKVAAPTTTNKDAQAIRIMAIKLGNIRSKVEIALQWLKDHNGPLVKRFFPKVAQVIALLEEILVIISEKATPVDTI